MSSVDSMKTLWKVKGWVGSAVRRSTIYFQGNQGLNLRGEKNNQQYTHNVGAFKGNTTELEGRIFDCTHYTNTEWVEFFLKNLVTTSLPS